MNISLNITNPSNNPIQSITWEACAERCQLECVPNLINAFIHNNLSLIGYAVVLLVLYAICINNFDDVLKKIRSFPQTTLYPAQGLKMFLNMMFLIAILLILAYVLLLKFNIR